MEPALSPPSVTHSRHSTEQLLPWLRHLDCLAGASPLSPWLCQRRVEARRGLGMGSVVLTLIPSSTRLEERDCA